jgi:hypothetical protein
MKKIITILLIFLLIIQIFTLFIALPTESDFEHSRNNSSGSSWHDTFENSDNIETWENLKIESGNVILNTTFNTDWKYRLPIRITEQSGTNLTDYHILIKLTNENFDYTKAQKNGDDIHIEDENNIELNFWIEEWDNTETSKIWVKIPAITAKETLTIYLYYGNPSATSKSNWESTILPYVDSQATASAGWSVRSGHQSVIFNNKMWVIGGSYFSQSSYSYYNDVWYSLDGITWIQATENAGWHARAEHQCIVFNNKMWVIGGLYSVGLPPYDYVPYELNDVWYSSDGKIWEQATANAEWGGRHCHQSIVFDNKMWVIGGYDQKGGESKNDVWYSSNGINWTHATLNADWSKRYGHQCIVFDNKMWVIGYYESKVDVWYSSDGETWEQATDEVGCDATSDYQCIVFDNKIWLTGGWNGCDNIGYKNDVWYSNDGRKWIQATVHAGWCEREEHQVVVFDNMLWLIGGDGGGYKTDVWRLLRTYASPEPGIVYGVEETPLKTGMLITKLISIPIGNSWNTLCINKTLPVDTYLNISVLDASSMMPLNEFGNLTGSTINLSLIDSLKHPSIRLMATYVSNMAKSPTLHDWTVTWTEPPQENDKDGDGVEDSEDYFPDNPNEWEDTDEDGVGDNSDTFPTDPTEWVDSDGDGYGDNSDAYPDDPTRHEIDPGDPDSDGDGRPDSTDAFPNDPSEWVDTDGDGYGDNSDEFPNDPSKHSDEPDESEEDDDEDEGDDGGLLGLGKIVGIDALLILTIIIIVVILIVAMVIIRAEKSVVVEEYKDEYHPDDESEVKERSSSKKTGKKKK